MKKRDDNLKVIYKTAGDINELKLLKERQIHLCCSEE